MAVAMMADSWSRRCSSLASCRRSTPRGSGAEPAPTLAGGGPAGRSPDRTKARTMSQGRTWLRLHAWRRSSGTGRTRRGGVRATVTNAGDRPAFHRCRAQSLVLQIVDPADGVAAPPFAALASSTRARDDLAPPNRSRSVMRDSWAGDASLVATALARDRRGPRRLARGALRAIDRHRIARRSCRPQSLTSSWARGDTCARTFLRALAPRTPVSWSGKEDAPRRRDRERLPDVVERHLLLECALPRAPRQSQQRIDVTIRCAGRFAWSRSGSTSSGGMGQRFKDCATIGAPQRLPDLPDAPCIERRALRHEPRASGRRSACRGSRRR